MAKKKTTLTQEEILAVKERMKKHDSDVGSTTVQISALTGRITHLTAHVVRNNNDKHSRRGLIGMVSKRRKLLKYLKRTDAETHAKTLAALGIRK